MTVLPILLLSAGARAGEIRAKVLDGDKPLEGAVVYVVSAPGKFTGDGEAVMDQVKQEFVPRVLPVLAGTKVRFPNKDNIQHHIYSFSKAKKFDVLLYKNEPAEPVVMDQPGVVKLGCNIHDWMLGYVLVLPNPYFARAGADGVAVIKNVPQGKYKVAACSERVKGEPEETAEAVTVGAKAASVELRPKVAAARKPKKSAVTY